MAVKSVQTLLKVTNSLPNVLDGAITPPHPGVLETD